MIVPAVLIEHVRPREVSSNEVSMFSIDYCPLFGFTATEFSRLFSGPSHRNSETILVLVLSKSCWNLCSKFMWMSVDGLVQPWSLQIVASAATIHYYNPFCMVAKDVYSKTQHNAIALMLLFSLRETSHIQIHPNSIKFCFILHLDSFRAPKSQTQASKHESFTENSGLLLSAPWWTSTALSMSWLACQGQVALTMPRGLRTNPPSSPHLHTRSAAGGLDTLDFLKWKLSCCLGLES